jgi:hypothetical protein
VVLPAPRRQEATGESGSVSEAAQRTAYRRLGSAEFNCYLIVALSSTHQSEDAPLGGRDGMVFEQRIAFGVAHAFIRLPATSPRQSKQALIGRRNLDVELSAVKRHKFVPDHHS